MEEKHNNHEYNNTHKRTRVAPLIIFLLFVIAMLVAIILLEHFEITQLKDGSFNKKLELTEMTEEEAKDKIVEVFGEEVEKVENGALVLTNNDQYMLMVVGDNYVFTDNATTPPTIHHYKSIKEPIDVEVLEIYDDGSFLAWHDDHSHRVYEPLPEGTKVGDIVSIKDPHTYLDDHNNTFEPEEKPVIESTDESSEESMNETLDESTDETSDESDLTGSGPNTPASTFDSLNYAYKAEEIRKLSSIGGYEGEKIAFLTFDDGPNNVITPGVLDVLKEKDVHATFFVLGNSIGDGTSSTLNRIIDEGHSIGTHSFDHNYDKLYPGRYPNADEIVSQHKRSVDAIKSYVSEDFNTNLFRYPGGHMSWNKEGLKVSDKALADIGVHYIDWNTMSGDAQSAKISKKEDIPRPKTTQDVIDNFEMSKRYTPNSDVAVILMHDAADKDITLESLPALIDHLKEQGYKFGVLK